MARSGVYVLRLEGERFYVGSSSDVPCRVAAHRARAGAAFTRKFGVVEELAPRTRPTEDLESWERAETLARMREHGVDNVRGWLYTTVRLSAAQRASVREQLRERFGQCRRCGGGHYMAQCALRREPRVLSERRLERESVYGDYDARGGERTAPRGRGRGPAARLARQSRTRRTSRSSCPRRLRRRRRWQRRTRRAWRRPRRARRASGESRRRAG